MFEVKVRSHQTATGWVATASWPTGLKTRQQVTLPHKASRTEALNGLRHWGSKAEKFFSKKKAQRRQRQERCSAQSKALAKFIDELTSEEGKRLAALLAIEKRRRGVSDNRIVFCGMADIAQSHWCQQLSVITARQMEPAYFHAYLSDRLSYAHKLGTIKKLPGDDESVLTVVSNISLSLSQIAQLFPETESSAPELVATRPGPRWHDKGVRDDAMTRGILIEAFTEPRHPSFRWAFPYGDLIVIGAPDGLYQNLAYEFKTTKKRWYIETATGKRAKVQVNLYGYFFEREICRLCFSIGEEGIKETCDYRTNREAAERTLLRFSKDVNSNDPVPAAANDPEERRKCKRCDKHDVCPSQKEGIL